MTTEPDLTPEERRDFAVHLANAIHHPDGQIHVPMSPSEARALADVLHVLATRRATDDYSAGTEHIFNGVATTMAGRLRTHLEQARADEERDREAGERKLPAIESRKLIDDWIRVLTLVGEGRGPEETTALIEKVNQPVTYAVEVRTPLPAVDVRAIEQSQKEWMNEIRRRQVGVHVLVE
ncbi:hypothetical protein DMP23_47675 [Amycolatopsis sp. A1MSW2902]|uniref:hypothetical protein n=1 Tax=Amycolatopsis sp. A1MSW2902 TaxID=687413 RepID=UPI00307D5801